MEDELKKKKEKKIISVSWETSTSECVKYD